MRILVALACVAAYALTGFEHVSYLFAATLFVINDNTERIIKAIEAKEKV